MSRVLDVDARELVRARRVELERYTRAGVLFTEREGELRCSACAHRCVLADGAAGACGVRVRRGNELRVPYGYVARRYVRAIETNTIFHLRPGTQALTFGMYGCDLRCPYCQNFRLSQALRDAEAGGDVHETTPAALVEEAVAAGASTVCAAYNEPLITAEWAQAVFAEARAHGLATALVTDGHSTPEVLDYLRPVTDVFRVDLKGFTEAQYRTLGGRLRPVLDAIATAKELGYWVEVVTLVVPGLNDDERGIRWIADALRAIDPSIPWHLDAFQPRYRLRDRPPPPSSLLFQFAAVAYARGLSFVYVGNVTNDTFSATRCPACHQAVVERHDWQTSRNALESGRCPHCAFALPGLW